MTEKVTLQGLNPSKKTPANLGPPPVAPEDPVVAERVAAEAPLQDKTAVDTPQPAKAAVDTPPPASAAVESPAPPSAASSSDTPAPEKAAVKLKRGVSVAQKAIIAERTDRILKSAKPGSAEYADACRDRAEAGLVVPAMKHTAISLHAFEQFATMAHAEEKAAHQKVVRKTALSVIAGLVVLAAALGAYLLFTHNPNAGAAASSTASSATPPAASSVVASKRPATAPTEATAIPPSPVESASSADASSKPSVAPPPTNTQPVRPTGNLPSAKPTAAPSAKSTSSWDPTWVAPK